MNVTRDRVTIAEIPYTADTGEKLVNETFGPNNISRRRTGAADMRPMEISDGRAADLSLERNGFVLVEHQTAMKNFFDAEELKRVYYPGSSASSGRPRAPRAR